MASHIEEDLNMAQPCGDSEAYPRSDENVEPDTCCRYYVEKGVGQVSRTLGVYNTDRWMKTSASSSMSRSFSKRLGKQSYMLATWRAGCLHALLPGQTARQPAGKVYMPATWPPRLWTPPACRACPPACPSALPPSVLSGLAGRLPAQPPVKPSGCWLASCAAACPPARLPDLI